MFYLTKLLSSTETYTITVKELMDDIWLEQSTDRCTEEPMNECVNCNQVNSKYLVLAETKVYNTVRVYFRLLSHPVNTEPHAYMTKLNLGKRLLKISLATSNQAYYQKHHKVRFTAITLRNYTH
jgi:hypothetical protein